MKLKYLKETTRVVFCDLFTEGEAWRALGECAFWVGVFGMRLLFLVTFPISIPFLAFLAEYSDKKDAESFKKANKDFFEGLHKERVSK